MNKDVISAIDANVDFKLYDNWKLQSGQFVFQEHNADGYVDMIFMCYRFPDVWFDIEFAFATLGRDTWTVVKDGKNIYCPGFTVSSKSSGLTLRNALNDEYTIKQTMIHEFGHFLFGACHTTTGGIMAGVGNVARTLALNGWESVKLGYSQYNVASSDGYEKILRDFVTYGDVLKIPIPFNDPTSSTFFIVENHQRLSMYDQIIRGSSLNGGWNFTTTLGKGIYIYYITNGNSNCCNNAWRTADGSWDWVLNGTIQMPPGWPSTMPLTKRNAINRNTGKSDRHHQNIYWYDGQNSNWWAKWHDEDPITSQYVLTRDIMGDEYDAWNIGYNEIFSPWSNPSTYSGGTTNISVQLYSMNGNEITIKVFSTEASGLALSPAKPQALYASFSGPSNVSLTWITNIESDVTTGGGYDLYRSIYYDGATLSYTKVNSTLLQTSSYTDNPSIPGGIPVNKDVYWRYNVKAKDNQSKYSVPSEDFWLYIGKTVSGTIASSTTWDVNRIVVGNVTVNSGKTLTISPGVIIRSYPIQVLP